MPARPPAERDGGKFEQRLAKITKSGPPQLASLRQKEPAGFVMDYQILGTGYSLAGGTYLVEDSEGYTSGTLDAGVIIKFRATGALRTSTIQPHGNGLTLTSADDDSVGEIIEDSTGTPSGYYGYFQVDGPVWEGDFGSLEARYMLVGIDITYGNQDIYGGTWTFRHCDTGIRLSADDLNVSVTTVQACDTATPVDPGSNSFSPSIGSADCDGDLDNNGMNDGWEVRYFGSTGQNPAGDPDGDGVSNLQEYLLGRNPRAGAVPDSGGVVRLTTFTPLK
jgi:hypothetical protein